MLKSWSLLNLKQKKLWPGLTEREVCVSIAFMQSEIEHIYVHNQGDANWTPASEAQRLLDRNSTLFDDSGASPFEEPS